jgi:hypothetical protein
VVNRPGNEFLAGTGFAADEHGRIALGDFADHGEHLVERGAAPDDAFEVVRLLLFVTQVIEFVP